MSLFLKGYKLDRQKIRSEFPRKEHQPEDTYHVIYSGPIINSIPSTAYKYVGAGVEPDGDIVEVLVLEDGYDLNMLDGIITPPNEFPKGALSVLTPGIWPEW